MNAIVTFEAFASGCAAYRGLEYVTVKSRDNDKFNTEDIRGRDEDFLSTEATSNKKGSKSFAGV